MGKTHAEFAVLLKMLIGYEFVMDSYELVMSACEISMIYLCIFETIYAVLLLRVGPVVVHLCDHNFVYEQLFRMSIAGERCFGVGSRVMPGIFPTKVPRWILKTFTGQLVDYITSG